MVWLCVAATQGRQSCQPTAVSPGGERGRARCHKKVRLSPRTCLHEGLMTTLHVLVVGVAKSVVARRQSSLRAVR